MLALQKRAMIAEISEDAIDACEDSPKGAKQALIELLVQASQDEALQEEEDDDDADELLALD